MIYGELGVKPLKIDIKTRAISFWSKLISQEGNKLSASMYQIIFHMHQNNIIKSEYIKNMKTQRTLKCTTPTPTVLNASPDVTTP